MNSTTRRLAAVTGTGAAAVAALIVPAATGSAQPPVCAAETLNLNILQLDPPTEGQNRLTVVLTNKSAQSCVVQGFPSAELVGPEDPAFGPTYQLPRQEAGFAPVLVEPGAAARSELTYLAGGPDGWVPATLVVTPPDTTTPMRAPWPAGLSVQRQDAATHPGTFVGPLRPV
ncbi:DUF4232 domain-containing protein [Nocardia blacklockiae]|uniref:DUF4232 domain-containing protein n=1 Tax=Nocardia blacklockiae TaxID=480036 RepID=UPI0018956E3D|nr:DUF4232 domain-containing protein [Nocardia blacklockiae]MBF6176364.1 DUF4232 domain-containing protein [Nocardia blacklockiae]